MRWCCWCWWNVLARAFTNIHLCIFVRFYVCLFVSVRVRVWVCLFICSFSVHVPYLFYPICPNQQQHGEKRFIIIFIFCVRATQPNMINNRNNNNSSKFRSHISTHMYMVQCTWISFLSECVDFFISAFSWICCILEFFYLEIVWLEHSLVLCCCHCHCH